MDRNYTKNQIIMFSFFCKLIVLSYCNKVNETSTARANEELIQLRQNYSYSEMDIIVETIPGLLNGGIVQISFPNSFQYQLVCFPSHPAEEKRQAAMLAHVLCRHLGYATYAEKYRHNIPSDMKFQSFPTNGVRCLGHEQSISQCKVDNTSYTESCDHVMAVKCTACYNNIEASNGTIVSPGFPYAYFYTVNCEWTITVPDKHFINLTFEEFFLPQTSYRSSLDCEDSDVYVEIKYTMQHYCVTKRFCIYNSVNFVEIPTRKVTIKFSSGVFNSLPKLWKDYNREYGFNASFRAIPLDRLSSQALKWITVVIGVLIFLSIALFCYCCRKWHFSVNDSRTVARNRRFVPQNVHYTRSLGRLLRINTQVQNSSGGPSEVRQPSDSAGVHSVNEVHSDLGTSRASDAMTNRSKNLASSACSHQHNPKMSLSSTGDFISCSASNSNSTNGLKNLDTSVNSRVTEKSPKVDEKSNRFVMRKRSFKEKESNHEISTPSSTLTITEIPNLEK